MQVNKILFIIKISKNTCFITGEHIGYMLSKTLVKFIKQVKKSYMQRGFCVTEIRMDRKFELIRDKLAELQINMNVVSRYEHVLEAYNCIRTMK